jgi:hypothetical protein
MTVAGIRAPGSFAALLVAASLLAFQSKAQEEVSPSQVQVLTEPALTHATALETYLERPGILLVKRHHPLAPVELQGGGKLRLDAVAAHEPGMQHQRMMGVRIEVDAPGLTGEKRVFYVDVHEIEELVRAIGFMMSSTEAEEFAQGDDGTEISISTRDGLEVGVLFAAGGTGHFLRTPSSTFAVQRAGFEALRLALDEARERLFSH